MLATSHTSRFRTYSRRASLTSAAGGGQPRAVRVVTLTADSRRAASVAPTMTPAAADAFADDLELATWEDAEWR